MRAEARIRALGLALPGGRDEAFSGGGMATVTPMFVTMTARDLRELGPEKSLTVERDGAYPTVFEFDRDRLRSRRDRDARGAGGSDVRRRLGLLKIPILSREWGQISLQLGASPNA